MTNNSTSTTKIYTRTKDRLDDAKRIYKTARKLRDDTFIPDIAIIDEAIDYYIQTGL